MSDSRQALTPALSRSTGRGGGGAAPPHQSRDRAPQFTGPIDRVRIGMGYRLGMLLAACVMLVLPVLYVGIIVAFGWLIWLHLTHDAAMLGVAGGYAGLFMLLLYVAPLIAGLILLAFMVKPLFARRVRRGGKPLEITRAEEPRLFELVDRLCDVVGAPRPRRINVDVDVNASASLRDGLLGFVRKDLTLTIGLPLAAGLTARQFVGVLAHEFGHFAQGTSMRLTYVVRSINAWFARLVYERDAWDRALATVARDRHGHVHPGVLAIVLLTRLVVWITRRILWVLMIIGHGVSSFLLRQMEFDADRYESRVAGAATAVSTFARLRTLSLATHAGLDDLSTAWQEKRLPDDLPLVIAAREREIPDQVRTRLHALAGARTTGLFDTHPCDGERITSIRRANDAGVFADERPAGELFTDFAELSKLATIKFYQDQLGRRLRPEHIVPAEQLVRRHGEQRQSNQAMRRYFAGLLRPTWPAFPDCAIAPVKDMTTAAEALLNLRSKFVELAEAAAPLIKQMSEADDKLVAVWGARALGNAGVRRIDAKSVGLPAGASTDDEGLRALERDAQRQQSLHRPAIDKALAIGMRRLELALSMAEASPVAATSPALPKNQDDESGDYSLSVDSSPSRTRSLVDALTALRAAAPHVETLRRHLVTMAAIFPQIKATNNDEHLVSAVLSVSRKSLMELESMRQALAGAMYPYEHGARSLSIAQFLIAARPTPQEIGGVAGTTQSALDGYYTLYARLMADLAHRAEQVEASLGLPPLSEVADSVAVP